MKKYIYVITACCILFLLVSMMFAVNRNVGVENEDWHRIETEEYESVFLSMYDISNYSEEYFSLLSNKKTLISQMIIDDFKDFVYCVKKIKSENPAIKSIYWGVDPVKLWNTEQMEGNDWIQENTLEFNSFFSENCDIRFEIILPYPQIEYWSGVSQTQMNTALSMYERIVQMCEIYKNVAIHYIGAEEWLVFNSDNYELNAFLVKKDVANRLTEDIVSKKYVVTADFMKAQTLYLKKQVEEKCFASNSSVDLSEWNIVFWGDSIIGLEHSNTSIPNLVNRFTGAKTYNMGIGGASASKSTKGTVSFCEMVNMESLKSIGKISESRNYFVEVQRFFKEYKIENKLCFVINFGINDYINGALLCDEMDCHNIDTYMGALRTAIDKLKKEYPHAEFVLMMPTYINSFLEGKEQNAVSGCTLQEYRNAIKTIAKEYNIYCKDNFTDLGVNSLNYWNYYLDDMHLNGAGRFLFAESFIKYFEANVLKHISDK